MPDTKDGPLTTRDAIPVAIAKQPASDGSADTGPPGRPRSLADVLHAVLSDGRKFAMFVALWMLMIFTAGVSIRLLLWIWQSSGLRATSVEISSSPKIVLEQVTKEGREYLLMVQPQGWMNSGITIQPGDEVEFQAQGRVNITSSSLNDHIQFRRRVERRLSAQRDSGRFGQIPDSLWLPERYYTSMDRDSLEITLPRGWLTPDGDTGPNALRDSRYAARARYRILPAKPYGALVGAVHASTDPPARYNGFASAFEIGSSRRVSYGGPRGTLWLTVNDVWDDGDIRQQDKFFIDNIGFFMVRVVIKDD